MEHALWNMGRALASFATMIFVAIVIENISYDFVRKASLIPLILYSGFIGILLFPTSLALQKAIGSDDAADILNELTGKILRKLHLSKK
jgi:putative peptidoglycan lipid II flippase